MQERIAPIDDVRTLINLVALMRRERFTVVHTHCAKAGMLGRLAARIVGIPVVVHTYHALPVHDFMTARRRALYLLMDRLARPLAHQYVAVAPRLAREAVEARVVRPGSITVVPSGIDLDQVSASSVTATRSALGIPDGAPVVGTVGRIVAQKAPLDFVRMAAQVKRSRPDAAFVMVGDATLESASLEKVTKEEAERLGVDILFTGYRADAAAIAAAFDVYVVPSIYEGLGRALTEAMVSGRPVVATSVNGVPDLVEPGATGLLAAPGDHAALAECVVWMLDNPQHARRMGAQGRSRVLSVFDADTMCRALDGIYSGLLGLPEEAVEFSSATAASAS
jgi:glycosyltransferase involved in cell wall biosynthesis